MQIWTWKGCLHAGRAAVLFGAVLVALAAVAPVGAARPRPASPARANLAAAVTEGTKVTLPETSIAGPGFRQQFTRIAWTGTDAAHHLNIATGPDGLHFPTKTTLPETSLSSPAVTDAVGSSGVAVAWTGTDPNHSLNVELGPGGTKLTLHESGLGAPAIAQTGLSVGQAALLLAWTGIDPNHSLNVLPLTPHVGGTGSLVLARGQKTVLRQFSSDAGPSLQQNVAGEFVLGWSVRGTQRLNLATSSDGATFTSALGAGLPQASAAAPQFVQPGERPSSNGCIAWTGTDPAHHLNVQCTTQFPQFPNPAQTKTVLRETALGAPGLFAASLGAPGVPAGEIAWTGTDPAHHLNVAQLTLP